MSPIRSSSGCGSDWRRHGSAARSPGLGVIKHGSAWRTRGCQARRLGDMEHRQPGDLPGALTRPPLSASVGTCRGAAAAPGGSNK
ncbi:hypothetical protein CCH79_00009315 [Gambusia affinis]|uniref:Uncharacterized protein n=1 Tax=Gambusia affinis TaxID=33528 RepID=A0A315W736_GAMAF|nr:hypothetical protein CCH79_00009315 [Gambusia affinis]